MPISSDEAKAALDKILKISRVHMYKPIQIAEILYRHRTRNPRDVNLSSIESYRRSSKNWRDVITRRFLNTVSTSSAKFQDNLFENNAIPPVILQKLGELNCNSNGLVESHVYNAFAKKHLQLTGALQYCIDNSKETFALSDFLGQFRSEAGLKRSIDKVFEIVVYSLFEVLTSALEVHLNL